jgi:hypothetical protein
MPPLIAIQPGGNFFAPNRGIFRSGSAIVNRQNFGGGFAGGFASPWRFGL